MDTILITGANGNLGRSLIAALQDSHQVVGCDVDTLDITDYDATRRFVQEHQPRVVINCAAWTDVDGCARKPDEALRVNGIGAHNVALAAQAANADIVQISSNEVFDGQQTTPYHEMATTRAANPYGDSKRYAEQAIQHTSPRHYIVRTAWLFAHGGRNFIHAIRNAAEAGKALRVVTDEIANPTYNDDLAAAIAQLIETQRYGIYHFVNEGSASRYAFARYILDVSGYADTPLTPISLSEWQRPSRPPYYAALANHAGRSLGIGLRTWQEAVSAFIAQENLS